MTARTSMPEDQTSTLNLYRIHRNILDVLISISEGNPSQGFVRCSNLFLIQLWETVHRPDLTVSLTFHVCWDSSLAIKWLEQPTLTVSRHHAACFWWTLSQRRMVAIKSQSMKAIFKQNHKLCEDYLKLYNICSNNCGYFPTVFRCIRCQPSHVTVPQAGKLPQTEKTKIAPPHGIPCDRTIYETNAF